MIMSLSSSAGMLATALLALPYLVAAVDITRNPGLVADLKTVATSLNQRELLSNDSDWVYDFPVSTLCLFALLLAHPALQCP